MCVNNRMSRSSLQVSREETTFVPQTSHRRKATGPPLRQDLKRSKAPAGVRNRGPGRRWRLRSSWPAGECVVEGLWPRGRKEGGNVPGELMKPRRSGRTLWRNHFESTNRWTEGGWTLSWWVSKDPNPVPVETPGYNTAGVFLSYLFIFYFSFILRFLFNTEGTFPLVVCNYFLLRF